MRLLPRRPPEAVRALAVSDRRLAWAITDDGVPLVATPSALHVGEEVLPWSNVARAEFAPPVLEVREVAEVDGTGPVLRLVIAEDHGLAAAVRTAVTSSVAWTDVRRLQPAGKVRVVARRVSGTDELLWQAVWLEGTDPQDLALRAQVEQLLTELRGSLG